MSVPFMNRETESLHGELLRGDRVAHVGKLFLYLVFSWLVGESSSRIWGCSCLSVPEEAPTIPGHPAWASWPSVWAAGRAFTAAVHWEGGAWRHRLPGPVPGPPLDLRVQLGTMSHP